MGRERETLGVELGNTQRLCVNGWELSGRCIPLITTERWGQFKMGKVQVKVSEETDLL